MCRFRRRQKAKKKQIPSQQTDARQDECNRDTEENHTCEPLAWTSLQDHLRVLLQMFDSLLLSYKSWLKLLGVKVFLNMLIINQDNAG